MMSRLMHIPRTYPLLFGSAFSTAKTSGADLAVQLKFENKEWKDVDWSRNAAFGLFGLFYLGGVQYFIYVPLFGRMFPSAPAFTAKSLPEKLKDFKGARDMLAQVFLDQCVHHPLLYFPVFYSLKAAVAGKSILESLELYKNNFFEDMVALWKVWVPATIFNFTFSPMYLRIPVVAMTSLIWTCILSAMRGSDAPPISADQAAEVIGNQGALVFSHSFEAAPLDPNLEHSVVLAHGPDRPGLVALVSSAIVDHAGGSISESKSVKLGNHYTIMMLVSTPRGGKRKLEEHLVNPLSPVGQLLQVTLSDVMEVSDQPSAQRALMNRKDSASSQPKTMFSFRVEGADRPGIVKEVTAVLAQHQVNCERLESNTKKPPMPKKNANGGSGSGGADASEPAGSAVFVLTGDAESSPGTDLDALMKDMESLTERMGAKFQASFAK